MKPLISAMAAALGSPRRVAKLDEDRRENDP